MLPPDSQVEIDAKIAAGYFSATSAAPPNLDNVKGRLVIDDLTLEHGMICYIDICLLKT